MDKRFVFVKDVQDWIAQGKTEMDLPEGACVTAAAADLAKEKGIRLGHSGAAAVQQAPPGAEQIADAPDLRNPGGLLAVASRGRTPSDPVGSVAARSPYFLFFDTEGAFLKAVENPHADVGGGAGGLVADFMGEKGVRTLVAGNFGKNIKADLDGKGIRYVEFSGSVEEAVKALRS